MHEEQIAATAGELWLEAAVDPGRWPDALSAVARSAGAHGAFLVTAPKIVEGLPTSPEIGSVVEDYYRAGWFQNDYRAIHSMSSALRNGIAVDQNFIDPAAMRREPFYQELLAPHGLQWFAGVAFSHDRRAWILSIQRTAAQGPFLAEEQDQLLRLRRSLISAARISALTHRMHARGMVEGLESLGDAAAVLDWTGTVIECNRAFAALPADTIRVRGGRPMATDHRSQEGLQAIITQALRFDPRRPADAALTLLRRPNGGALIARSVPVTHRRVLGLVPASALLLVRDPLSARPPPARALQQAFGLTPAESRLAEALLAGGRLEEVALRLGVKLETVRSQLKAIFDKTGTRRQTDLIGLLGRLL